MTRALMLTFALGGGALLALPPATASAQQQPTTGTMSEMTLLETDPYYPEIPEPGSSPGALTPFGTSLTIGGGIVGFTAERARDSSEVGGAWNARLVVGTRTPLAAEIAYVGSAQNVLAPGLDDDAMLLGNGGEVAARLGWPRGAVQPYLLAGAGFTHYALVNDDVNTSNIQGSDNLLHFPLGAGVAFRAGSVLIDARGVFRPSVDGDLFAEGENEMHTWSGSLNAGWEF